MADEDSINIHSIANIKFYKKQTNKKKASSLSGLWLLNASATFYVISNKLKSVIELSTGENCSSYYTFILLKLLSSITFVHTLGDSLGAALSRQFTEATLFRVLRA